MPFSSTKPRMAEAPLPASANLAHTTNTSAMGELLIHILLPLST